MMATGSKLQGGQYDDRCTPERSPTPGQFTTGDGSSVEITLAELNSGATHNSPEPATPPLPASDLNIQSVGPSFQQRSTPVSRIGSRPPTPQYPPDTQIKEIGVLQGQAASVQEYGPQSPQIDSYRYRGFASPHAFSFPACNATTIGDYPPAVYESS